MAAYFPQRQTRSRSRMANAPPLMSGLDYRGKATEPLPEEVPCVFIATSSEDESHTPSKKRKRAPLKFKLEEGRWKKARTESADDSSVKVKAESPDSSQETPLSALDETSETPEADTIVVDVEGSLAAMRSVITPPISPLTVTTPPFNYPAELEQHEEAIEASLIKTNNSPILEPELKEPIGDSCSEAGSMASVAPKLELTDDCLPELKEPVGDSGSETGSITSVAPKLELAEDCLPASIFGVIPEPASQELDEPTLEPDPLKRRKRGVQSTGDDLVDPSSTMDSFWKSVDWDSAETLPACEEAMAHTPECAHEPSAPSPPPPSHAGGSHDEEDGTLQCFDDGLGGAQQMDDKLADLAGLFQERAFSNFHGVAEAQEKRVRELAPQIPLVPLPRCDSMVASSSVCWTVGQPGSYHNSVWDARWNENSEGSLDDSDSEDENTDWHDSDH